MQFENLLNLFQKGFDYLLILNEESTIDHISDRLAQETIAVCKVNESPRGKKVSDVFSGSSLDAINSTISKLHKQNGREVMLIETVTGKPSIMLNAVMNTNGNGSSYMFWGSRFTALENFSTSEDWSSIERGEGTGMRLFGGRVD